MEATKNSTVYDVIIAGAGPVGLFLAGELAQAGCTVVLLERAAASHSPLKQLPFGVRGLNAPSVEALDRRGLLAELTAHQRLAPPQLPAPGSAPAPTRPPGNGHFAGIQIPASLVEAEQWPYRLPSAPPPMLLAELAEVEAVLTRRAEKLGVSIRRGVAITGWQQSPEAVTVQAADERWTGRWLVGCDGSRSAVRKAGGFDFAGTEPEFTGYSTLVDLADPEQLQPGRHVTATGMYMQAQPGYVILQDFDGGAFHASGQPITREHVQAVLRRVSGTDVTVRTLHRATTWTDRARQATTYRQGRVLLAGDAAHIHAPLGGQGLNLGLADALNLGWKLAATLRGQAPAGLLDSYYAERYPPAARVLDWSRAQVAIMRPEPAAQALRAILTDLMNTPDGATYFAGHIGGLATRYDLGESHPLTGYGVPNFALTGQPSVNKLLRDGRGLLLDFGNQPALRALADELGQQLRYVAGPAREQLGLQAVLVRPDGIVAWATDHTPDLPALRLAAARWLALPGAGGQA